MPRPCAGASIEPSAVASSHRAGISFENRAARTVSPDDPSELDPSAQFHHSRTGAFAGVQSVNGIDHTCASGHGNIRGGGLPIGSHEVRMIENVSDQRHQIEM